MGFGAYDESEQENQEIDAEDIDDENEDNRTHEEGDIEFDFGQKSTDELVDQLKDIKQ